MTWTIDSSTGNESDKIAHLVVPYVKGRGLDVGCGMRRYGGAARKIAAKIAEAAAKK